MIIINFFSFQVLGMQKKRLLETFLLRTQNNVIIESYYNRSWLVNGPIPIL